MESELTLLAHSEVPESSEGKGALVMKVKQTVIDQLKTLLFNNTSDIGGGEQVRTLFNKFHDAVFKVSERIVPIKSFVIDYLWYVRDLLRTTKYNKDSPLPLPPCQCWVVWCCPQTSWPAVQHWWGGWRARGTPERCFGLFLIRKSKNMVLICRFGQSVSTNFVTKEKWKGGIRSFV